MEPIQDDIRNHPHYQDMKRQRDEWKALATRGGNLMKPILNDHWKNIADWREEVDRLVAKRDRLIQDKTEIKEALEYLRSGESLELERLRSGISALVEKWRFEAEFTRNNGGSADFSAFKEDLAMQVEALTKTTEEQVTDTTSEGG